MDGSESAAISFDASSALKRWGRKDFAETLIGCLQDAVYEIWDTFGELCEMDGSVEDVSFLDVSDSYEDARTITAKVPVTIVEEFTPFGRECVINEERCGIAMVTIDRNTGRARIACSAVDDAEM